MPLNLNNNQLKTLNGMTMFLSDKLSINTQIKLVLWRSFDGFVERFFLSEK